MTMFIYILMQFIYNNLYKIKYIFSYTTIPTLNTNSHKY